MSDIAEIFKAYDIRGEVGTQLNNESVRQIALAYGDWLPVKGVVAVGHDMRPDSRELANVFCNGLTDLGFVVWDIGLVTSDMIYFAVGKWELAGGAVITASHNPGKTNGIKLYRDKVTAIGLDSGLDKIRDAVLSGKTYQTAPEKGKLIKKAITDEWVAHCLTFIDHLMPFKIAIDAGNGMAGAILPSILPKLPIQADELYFELDGTFPNHLANPQQVETLTDLIKIVQDKSLDFGIAFDGDGDRAAFVDDKGRPVMGSDLMTIMAKHYLAKYPGAKIVHDVRTSRSTQEFIREWGGEPIRTKAGRVNIGSKMREIGAPFGGETTGHIFFKENYDADSGLITALVAMQAITKSGRKLSELVDEYHKYPMIQETNIQVNKDKEVVFQQLEKLYPNDQADYLDGLTINNRDYWFNLRASNTEPIMRLNAEASSKEKLDQIVEQILGVIEK